MNVSAQEITGRMKIFFYHNYYRKSFILGMVILILFFTPYIILGEDSWFNFGYDSLDSNVIWNLILVNSGKMFSGNSDIIPQAMNGLPRVSYPGEFSIELWLYIFLKPIYAYITNIILIAVFAYTGMFLMLQTVVPKADVFILISVSLLYGFLPFWPHGGLSVAGLPLFFYGMLKVERTPWLSYGILIFYVLYSSFALTGIFLIALLCIYLLFIWIHGKKLPVKKTLFVAMLILFYLLTNYRSVLMVIYPDFVSHRADFVVTTYNLKESLFFFFDLLYKDVGHNLVIKAPIIISIFFLICFSILIKNISNNFKNIFQIILIIILLSFLSALFLNNVFYDFYTQLFPFTKQIQMQRFYWLLPPFFYLLYLLTLNNLINYKYGKYFVILLLIVHFGFIVDHNAMIKQLVKTKLFGREAGVISYKRFYSEDIYSEIDNFIGKDKSTYRVASIGLQPAAALYNGFYTVDGYYSAGYPKSYKDQIFRIIEPELKKDSNLYHFFNDWGSVCIIPSAELISQKYDTRGYIIPVIYKTDGIETIKNLDINTELLKSELNCQYIFSAAKITNSSQIGLEYMSVFENANSPYRILLYRIR